MATPETSKGLKGKAEQASNMKPAILTINDNPLIDNGTTMESKDKTQNVNIICEEKIPIVSNTDEIALSLGACIVTKPLECY